MLIIIIEPGYLQKVIFNRKMKLKKDITLLWLIYENGIVYYKLNITNPDEKIFINSIDNLVKKTS